MEQRIYLDNAATTPLLPEVVEVMQDVMIHDFGNPSSIHAHGRKARTIIENARKTMAKAINASISEVFFTSSATESNNLVIKNAVFHVGIKRIVSSPTEHHCVLNTIRYLEQNYDVEVVWLEVDKQGFINLEQLESEISKNDVATLVSIMHANNEIGTIQDIYQIGYICQKYGALFHSDTVQTIGKWPLDVQSIPIHFLSASAHKLHGPKGVGFVYINSNTILPPFIHGGSQERNMRAGTENVIGIAGFGRALELAITNMENRKKHILQLKSLFKSLLKEKLNGVEFLGSDDINRSSYHIQNVSFPHSEKSEMLVINLDIAGISVSSGSACTSGIEQESHVLKGIGHEASRNSVRFSFSHLNTEDDVNVVVQKLVAML